MTPKGGRVKGYAFATAEGQEVLRGASSYEMVLIGEGLTDFLALAIASP